MTEDEQDSHAGRDPGDGDRCLIETFLSKPLAEAFAYGLEWGDEPDWRVLIIHQVDFANGDPPVFQVHFEHVGDA